MSDDAAKKAELAKMVEDLGAMLKGLPQDFIEVQSIMEYSEKDREGLIKLHLRPVMAALQEYEQKNNIQYPEPEYSSENDFKDRVLKSRYLLEICIKRAELLKQFVIPSSTELQHHWSVLRGVKSAADLVSPA